MRKKIAVLALMLFVTLMLCVLSSIVIATSARIWTDEADYSPEETVAIYGAGFLPDTAVSLEITRPDSTVETWNTATDADGNFATAYLLEGITGTYIVTATDGTNTATTTFTIKLPE